jgi:VWFA-related protein
MRLHFSRFAALATLLLLPLFAFGQDDDPIKIDTNLIRLNVGVANRAGEPVLNLNRGDFTIYEDGVKQDISFFESVVAPFSVVMVLDMSGSTLGFRQVIAQAASRFVNSLGPDDRVAVIEFYDKVNLLNDFTTNRGIVMHSIGAANGRGKTQLYKAMDLALDKLAKEGKRRKAIVVLTDGVDTALRDKDRDFLAKLAREADIPTAIKAEENDTLKKLLSTADKYGVTIFPLGLPTGDPAKLADPTPTQVAMYQAARTRLQTMADRTGGRLNAINRLEEMGKFYAAVAADLRAIYTIEYLSSNDSPKKGIWRSIKIEVPDPKVIVRTKPGYFSR